MKQILVAILLVAGISAASAQDVYTSSGKPGYHKKAKKNKGYDPDKLIIGGGLNAGFGDGYVNVGVAPIVGYRFFESFSAGIGLGYQYYKNPVAVDPFNSSKFLYQKANLFYPSIWSRYFFYNDFFASGAFEFDFINVKEESFDYMGTPVTLKANVTNPCFLVGIGSRLPLGGRVSACFELIYDVLQGQYSPYPKGAPDIRVSFAAGL